MTQGARDIVSIVQNTDWGSTHGGRHDAHDQETREAQVRLRRDTAIRSQTRILQDHVADSAAQAAAASVALNLANASLAAASRAMFFCAPWPVATVSPSTTVRWCQRQGSKFRRENSLLQIEVHSTAWRGPVELSSQLREDAMPFS